MHRTIEVTVPPTYTDMLLHELEQLEDVINLSVVRGVSVKPPGDVLTVHALNRGADQVMSLADAAREHGEVSVSTAELTSLVDPKQEHKVANDVDEALWEEAETGLRHQGRTTSNFLTLMGMGGAIAATGFIVEATPQTIAFVSAYDHRARLRATRQGPCGSCPASLERGEEGLVVGGCGLSGADDLGGASLPVAALDGRGGGG